MIERPVTAADLSLPPAGEGTAEVAARVARARQVQGARASEDGLPTSLNAEAQGAALETIATPDEAGAVLLTKAASQLALSARAYHRTLRVARTIADLDGAGGIKRVHIAEALSFRRVWAGAAQAEVQNVRA